MINSKLHILMGHKKIKSIRQLAEETSITRLSLTKLYNGESKGIEFNTLNTLCKYFDCDICDILEYEKD
ncbi:Cro/Cl family transcriptional regulator [Paenibacillus riograndensis]|uniref:Cro/Cl family transcriptional regulator n=2 Tax=Paenibacillus riograndensis TaxID=483937 RepID=A0A132TJR7_9BACL|nr:Cro/Cl family transcriptional regulator [Paenibacillus riograndensis]